MGLTIRTEFSLTIDLPRIENRLKLKDGDSKAVKKTMGDLQLPTLVALLSMVLPSGLSSDIDALHRDLLKRVPSSDFVGGTRYVYS